MSDKVPTGSLYERPSDVRCEATGKCEWPRCDCDCNCFIPTLEGAGQHSPSCRTIKRVEADRYRETVADEVTKRNPPRMPR